MRESSSISILNANYIAFRLKDHYNVLYTDKNGLCAHEFIIDIKPLKVIILFLFASKIKIIIGKIRHHWRGCC
jgi:hypothetical protein